MNSLFLARYQQIGILVVALILLFLVVYVVLEYTRKNRTSPKAKENFRQRNLPTLEKGKVELYVGNLVYEMTDAAGNTACSQAVQFDVADGEIYTSALS